MFDQFLQSLAASGPLGIICAILLLRDSKREEQRIQLEQKRIEADKALAVSMTLLSERVR